LHRARRKNRRAARPRGSDRLAFDRALDNAAAALLGRLDDALARLDVARAGDRIDLDQLSIDIGRKIGRARIQRLGHAHRTTLQQCDTCRSGRELRDSQFERHGPIPCVHLRTAGLPQFLQIQPSIDAKSCEGAIGLTTRRRWDACEPLGKSRISAALSRTGTENRTALAIWLMLCRKAACLSLRTGHFAIRAILAGVSARDAPIRHR
jgi:hypothetical protein